jgi:phospholipid N-methyltransferase
MNELKQLSSEQLERFNTEYVDDEMWNAVVNFIDKSFETGKFTFMDIGGGNGVFTDKILAYYPHSEAILLDNAPNLIEINTQQARKTIIMDSAENIEHYLNTYEVDIIFINWVLHHLVSNTYQKTRNNVLNILGTIKRNERVKYVAIFENMYNGILFDSLPSKIIYHITSLQSVKRLTKKMGANTAGIGVSFLSKKTWLKIFNAIFGSSNVSVVDFHLWEIPVVRKVFLHIKNTHMSLCWIKNN